MSEQPTSVSAKEEQHKGERSLLPAGAPSAQADLGARFTSAEPSGDSDKQPPGLLKRTHFVLDQLPPWWWVVMVVALGIFLGLGSLRLLRAVAHPLGLIIFAVTIAAALSGPVRWLDRFMHRGIAVILVYASAVLGVSLLVLVGTPIFEDQVSQLTEEIPSILNSYTLFSPVQIEGTEGGGAGVGEDGRPGDFVQGDNVGNPNSAIRMVSDMVGGLGERLLTWPVTLASGMLEAVLTVVLSIYLLMSGPKLRSFVCTLIPSQNQKRFFEVVDRMLGAAGGYLRGVAISALIVGTLTFVGLRLLGVNYPLALALLAGILEFIPLLGSLVAGTVISLVALLQSPTLALFTLGFSLLLQQIEGNLIFPMVMSNETDISPTLSLIAFFVGGATGGLLGALIAIPVVAALRIFFQEVIVPRLQAAAEARSTT